MMRLEEPLDKESVWHIWSKERERDSVFRVSWGLFFYFYRLFIVAFNFQTFLIDLTDGRNSKSYQGQNSLSKEPFYNIHIKS